MRKLIIFVLFALLAHSHWVQAQDELKLKRDAPDRYIVEKGDTLWGIATKFLKDPWRWAEIWRVNQEQIRNPHRIQPGDVIVLDRSKRPALLVRNNKRDARDNTVKLAPTVYSESYAERAIPAISPRYIEPFLSRPLVIETGGLDKVPRIVGTQSGSVYLGSGGVAYVSGIGDSEQESWEIFRPGAPLVDPDTSKILGIEAIHLGTARVVRAGEPATVRVVSATREISQGDRLLPSEPAVINRYAPHPPTSFIKGRIISVFGGLKNSEGGKYSIVSINKGSQHALEMGHVLAVKHTGNSIPDPQSNLSRDKAPQFRLPDERYGLLFVFRVFNAVSYALVMETSLPVVPGDTVNTP